MRPESGANPLSELSRRDIVEGGVLIFAAPLLLFPQIAPWITGAALASLVAVWMARWMLARETLPVTPINASLMGWLMMVAVGAAVSAFPDQTIPKATGIVLGVAVWRYLALLARRRVAFHWAFMGFVLLGLGIIFLGGLVTDWPTKVPLVRRWVAQLSAWQARLGPLALVEVHANELGGALTLYFPVALAFFTEAFDRVVSGSVSLRSNSRGRLALKAVLGAVAYGFVGIVLVMTQSRSAWIGAAVGSGLLLVLWVLIAPRSRLRTVLRIVLFVGAVSVMVVGVWMGPARLRGLWEEPELTASLGGLSTVDFRFEVWRWALAGIQDFAFTGCGLGTFREVVRLLYPLNVPVNYDIAHAHNIFFQVALDTGVPGLIAYLALLGIAIMMGWRVAVRNVRLRPAALGLIAGIMALHVYGLTDALAPGSKPGIIFWYALGLLTMMGLRTTSTGDADRSGANEDLAEAK